MLYEIFSINFIKYPYIYIYSSTGDCNESSGSQYLYTNSHANFDTIKQLLLFAIELKSNYPNIKSDKSSITMLINFLPLS